MQYVRILVPPPGAEPKPSAMRMWNLNHQGLPKKCFKENVFNKSCQPQKNLKIF